MDATGVLRPGLKELEDHHKAPRFDIEEVNRTSKSACYTYMPTRILVVLVSILRLVVRFDWLTASDPQLPASSTGVALRQFSETDLSSLCDSARMDLFLYLIRIAARITLPVFIFTSCTTQVNIGHHKNELG